MLASSFRVAAFVEFAIPAVKLRAVNKVIIAVFMIFIYYVNYSVFLYFKYTNKTPGKNKRYANMPCIRHIGGFSR